MTLSTRANNPLSLVYTPAIKYQGLADPPYLEHLFAFQTPQLGVRAAALNLKAYQKRGLTTITQIIPVWSPKAAGNPTEAYIADVAQWSGIPKDRPIAASERLALFKAMSRQEGEECPESIIQEGLEMAGESSSGALAAVRSHVQDNSRVYGGTSWGTLLTMVTLDICKHFGIPVPPEYVPYISAAWMAVIAQLFPKGVPSLPE